MMITDLLEKLDRNENARQNLSALRGELKKTEDETVNKILFREEDSLSYFITFLKSEDAKTRKNAALLLGDIAYILPSSMKSKEKEILGQLYQAYQEEKKLFVKSSYLQAMGNYDCRGYLKQFEERIEELANVEVTEENKKHIHEESRELSNLMIQMKGVQKHKFTGYQEINDIVLLANRNYLGVLEEELIQNTRLSRENIKTMTAGLRVQTENLSEILDIRIWQELLFVVKGMKTCEMDAHLAAAKIAESGLIGFLEKRHKGTTPFFFRVELKSKMSLDKKSLFTKRLANELEHLSERKLINTTTDYEVEIRLIENREGACNILVKLYTLPDDRFSYRQEVLPCSIKPVNAALLVTLAKSYMSADAQVLDPFCGVGTMLIERQKQVPANTSYGIDIKEEAIEKAKSNTKVAEQIIHYVNRDSLTFTHEYLFDEIFSNMPFVMGRIDQNEIIEVYEGLFQKIGKLLQSRGKIIIYTHDTNMAKQIATRNGYQMVKEWKINKKEETSLIIFCNNN